MKENIGEELKNNKGITLVALVVTIIVLLILSAVSLSAIFRQDGIFNKAEQAADKYSQAKARETLEMLLGEAQMQKYEEELTEEQLDRKIQEIGELLPKENSNPNIQDVIVDGYIFKVDKSIPKIIDYVGPADGVIITAVITGNDDWIKQSDIANINVTGKIKTYSGGKIKKVTATKNGATITDFSINEEGRYSINNLKEDTIIVINAEDSNDKIASKTVTIKMKIDDIQPVLSNPKATVEEMKIKISVNAIDNESGLKQINYSISPTTISSKSGTLISGQEIELIAAEEGEYTIIFSAEDNVGNVSTNIEIKVVTVEGITLEQAKEKINKDNLKDFIGKKITNYNPEAGGTWRVFYYDSDNYFGDGIGTLYIKRDIEREDTALTDYYSYIPSDKGKIMKQMNPLWRDSDNGNEIDYRNEHCVAWLCDSTQWTKYKTGQAKYAIGSPSVEMYMKAYNTYKENTTALVCKIGNLKGYSVGANNSYENNSGYSTANNTIDKGKNNIFLSEGAYSWWLASPTSYYENHLISVYGSGGYLEGRNHTERKGVCPIATICK